MGYVSCIHDTCTFSHIYETHSFLDFTLIKPHVQSLAPLVAQSMPQHQHLQSVLSKHRGSTNFSWTQAHQLTQASSLGRFWKNAGKQQFWVRPVLTWTSYQAWAKWCSRSLTPIHKCINGSTEFRHLLPRRLRPMASAMKAWVNSHKSTHKFDPQGHQSKIPTLQTWSNRANWDLLKSRSVIPILTHEKDKKEHSVTTWSEFKVPFAGLLTSGIAIKTSSKSISTANNKRTSGRVDEESSSKSFPFSIHSLKYRRCIPVQMFLSKTYCIWGTGMCMWMQMQLYIDSFMHGQINNHDLHRLVLKNRKEHIQTMNCICVHKKETWSQDSQQFPKKKQHSCICLNQPIPSWSLVRSDSKPVAKMSKALSHGELGNFCVFIRLTLARLTVVMVFVMPWPTRMSQEYKRNSRQKETLAATKTFLRL